MDMGKQSPKLPQIGRVHSMMVLDRMERLLRRIKAGSCLLGGEAGASPYGGGLEAVGWPEVGWSACSVIFEAGSCLVGAIKLTISRSDLPLCT